MELKPGYKLTEIGVLPDDWDVKQISEIAEVKGGKRLPQGKNLTDSITSHPYVRVTDMYRGGINLANVRYVPEDAYPSIKNYRISSDDIFISVAGTLGIVGKVPKELDGANLTENADKITSIQCDRDYLLCCLMGERIQNGIIAQQTQGAQPKLALNRIEGFIVPVPPIPEQRAIAAAISDTDALLSSLDRLLAKKRDIKQAVMQQLLTGKQRLPGFSGKWEVKRFGDILRVRHGKSQRGVEASGGKFPILATGGEIGRTNQFLYDKPSVLIGRKGTIDFPQYVESPFWTIDTLFYTEVASTAVPKFLFYLFNTINWRNYNEASGVPSLNASTIESIEINCPKQSEQTAIAAVLSDMDAEIDALQQRRDKTRAIKQGMMQELLTGRKRLV